MRGAAAGMALEIRLSFCGLDSVFFAIKAIAAAMAKKMSAPRGNILLVFLMAERSVWGVTDKGLWLTPGDTMIYILDPYCLSGPGDSVLWRAPLRPKSR